MTLCLPFALVPYYLLAKEPRSSMPSIGQAGRLAGIFDALQVGIADSDGDSASGFKTDSWLNFARVCMVVLILHSIVLWVAQAKDISLRALGIRREGRAKAQRWLSVCFWILVTGIACIGGRFADKLEWIGSACVISVGWLIPGKRDEVLPCSPQTDGRCLQQSCSSKRSTSPTRCRSCSPLATTPTKPYQTPLLEPLLRKNCRKRQERKEVRT